MRQPKKLKEFGADSMATDNGYDLELLVSWIEVLTDAEETTINNKKRYTQREWERLEKAQNALQMLQEVLNY